MQILMEKKFIFKVHFFTESMLSVPMIYEDNIIFNPQYTIIYPPVKIYICVWMYIKT